MAGPLIRARYLPDQPSVSSVSLLASRLGDDFVSGSVSAKGYDHRSRVVRQQSALLGLQASEDKTLGAPGYVTASSEQESGR
jgi:hypothetical protein